MSENEPENESTNDSSNAVGDDQLPEDLQPGEDNPLARHPGQTGDAEDEIGADTEAEPETAPLDQDDADYGGAGGSDDD